MLFNTVAFSALLLGSATATIVHERFVDDEVSALYKRQYQFQPGTQTATGNTCADAFGTGYTICMSRDHGAYLQQILIPSFRSRKDGHSEPTLLQPNRWSDMLLCELGLPQRLLLYGRIVLLPQRKMTYHSSQLNQMLITRIGF